MNINIFLICYNESIIIENTINHYKERFPNSIIYILNNYSTDNSVEIAINKNCKIINSTSEIFKNNIDELELLKLKNEFWKDYEKGWTIICDMDELLDINENDLIYETSQNVTIINTLGIQMVGESREEDLSDICIKNINKGYFNERFNKRICFNSSYINDINFSPGAHQCNPMGEIKYSHRKYYLKHYNYLGEKYYINKILNRHKRKPKEYLKIGWDRHYINDINKIKETYYSSLNKSKNIDEL